MFTSNISHRFAIAPEEVLHPMSGPGLSAVHPDDLAVLRAVLSGERQDLERGVTLRFLSREGKFRWMRCQGQVVRDRQGKKISLVGKISDINEEKAKEELLIEKFSLDGMTGALNREAARKQIEKRLAVSKRGFLIMVDLDNFKEVNDTLGHPAGDDLLIQFVLEMRREFRKEDIVGRMGGDEFVVFLDRMDDREAVGRKAAELLARFRDWRGQKLSASLGIAAFPADGTTYQELYQAADAALYCAKRKGKNTYCFTEQADERKCRTGINNR